MRNMSRLDLSKQQKEEMKQKVQDYFFRERDEELGDLSASIMVDFIISELGEVIYNKGIEDAHRYMSERVEELLDLQKY